MKRESSKRKCFRTEQLFDTLKMRTSKQKDNECKLSTVRLFNKLITSENEKRMYYYRRNQKNRTNVSVLIEAGQYKQTFNPSFFVTFSE